MKKFSFIFCIIFAIFMLSSCIRGNIDSDSGDSNSNSNSDTEGFIEGESNIDSSTDINTDIDSSINSDTDIDSEVDSDYTYTYVVSVEYSASEGGTIVGETNQLLELVDGTVTTSTVSAVADEGYRFVSWSDGLTTPERTDTVSSSQGFVATFIKVHTVTFKSDLTYGVLSGRETQFVDDGEKTTPVSAYPRRGYKFSHWSNGMTDQEIVINATESIEIEAIYVFDELSLPILSITTEGLEDITSKEEYLSCLVNVENTDEKHLLSDEAARIRGRGNTSWEYDKKPYKLKFDSKVDLFGNGEAKDWTLIANHSDLSLSRNYLAQSVASLFPTLKGTTAVQFVELYLNYEYVGVYLVCEQIEVQSNRVNITEDTEIDTGYLIELDGRKDGYGFTLNDSYYVIKNPDTDLAAFSAEHEAFISGYLSDCLNSLSGEDYKRVKELIDVESFAEAYIVYELFKCVDVGYSSFYMHKDAGGRLICGPVWDFDRSLGIVGHSSGAKEYDTLWAKEQNEWFGGLLAFPEFEALVSEKLYEYAPLIEEKLYSCYDYLYTNRDSFDRNFEKWNILGTFVWPNDDELTELDTWDLQVEYTREYLTNSLYYLLSVY